MLMALMENLTMLQKCENQNKNEQNCKTFGLRGRFELHWISDLSFYFSEPMACNGEIEF